MILKITSYNVTHSLMRDGYVLKQEKIKLSNGNQLNVYTEFKDGKKATKLQYMVNNLGQWVKSKLRYYSGNKVFRTLYGERNDNNNNTILA